MNVTDEAVAIHWHDNHGRNHDIARDHGGLEGGVAEAEKSDEPADRDISSVSSTTEPRRTMTGLKVSSSRHHKHKVAC
jgi:hypothetical protein